MKRKKLISAAVALALSAIVLTVTAFAATQGIQSYERFKQAGFALKDEDNLTVDGLFKLYVDGEEFGGGNFEMKAEDDYRTTTKMTLGDNEELGMVVESDEEQVRNIYMLPDGSYMRQVLMEYNKDFRNMIDASSDPMSETETRLANALIDMAAGDLKNYFTMDENRVSFNLSENQIPEVFQLLLAVASEHADESYSASEYHYDNDFSVSVSDGNNSHTINYSRPDIDPEVLDMFEQLVDELDTDMTKLSTESFGLIRNNPVAKSIGFEGTLNEAGQIETVQGSMVLTGQDENGVDHEVKFYMEAEISDIGTTVCDFIDLEGENVTELPSMSSYDTSGWINTFVNEEE